MSWSDEFEDPIILPNGRKLVALRDAATYITKLPKADHAAPEWQAAMQALILVAENGRPTMLPRIGVMKALNRYTAPNETGSFSWPATSSEYNAVFVRRPA